MFLYKKQIRPIFEECAWQGFSSSCVPLEDWIDISTNEEDIEKELKEKWTDEKIYEVTHDHMGYLKFEYRFIESYLVCNDKNSNTGKSKDAKALGIPIITEEELNALG